MSNRNEKKLSNWLLSKKKGIDTGQVLLRLDFINGGISNIQMLRGNWESFDGNQLTKGVKS